MLAGSVILYSIPSLYPSCVCVNSPTFHKCSSHDYRLQHIACHIYKLRAFHNSHLTLEELDNIKNAQLSIWGDMRSVNMVYLVNP